MAQFMVRGAQNGDEEGYDPVVESLLSVSTRKVVDFGLTRGGGEPEALEIGEGDEQVVELELENGLKLWVRADQLSDTLEVSSTRGGPPELTNRLRIGAGQGQASRGAVDWVLKGLKLLDIDLVDRGARIAALALARKIEDRAFSGEGVVRPGLYRAETPYHLSPVTPAEIAKDRPVLILIHGTGSTTSASFGALAGPDPTAAKDRADAFWEAMKLAYGDQIYALQHRTLSESPVRNAVELMEALPEGARLHLLTYSRGGLIGDLLARAGSERLGEDGGVLPGDGAAFDARDFEIFEKAVLKSGTSAEKEAHAEARAREVADLKRLSELLAEKAPRIERFVRVASPSRGTTLASGKLDKYLNIALNVLEHVPFLKENPIVGLTKAFLLAVVKERTRPDVIPGLEAMMRRSPLVAALNRPDVRLRTPLAAIAGDIEPSGIFHALKVYATDLFYPDDHDLVVDTDAMVGGSLREPAARYFFDRGPEVHHFGYFSNERTRGKIREGLEGQLGGFHALTEADSLTVRAAPPRHDPARTPRVFLLPGIMGTHLGLRGNRIWLDYFDMALGGIAKLDLATAKGRSVGPHDLIGGYYDDLDAHLSQTHIVHRFPYDWRKPVVEAGADLNAAVGDVLDEIRAEIRQAAKDAGRPLSDEAVEGRLRTVPIRFVAHSMGGLVVRAMVSMQGSNWPKVSRHEGARVVMLGTPNGGSHSVVAGLVGQSETVGQLATLDITHSRAEVIDIIGRIPGFLDLLPWKAVVTAGEDVEEDGAYYSAETWERFAEAMAEAEPGWCAPDAADLGKAADLPKQLGDIDEDLLSKLVYVAGSAPATPVGLKLVPGERPDRRVQVLNTVAGDGRVPWATGIPPEMQSGGKRRSQCYYSAATHGDLARHRPDFPAIAELLAQGETTRLPREPAGTRAARDAVFVARPPAPPRPDRNDLPFIGMGGGRTSLHAEVAAEPTRVVLAHENLAFCGRLITVGHYEGDVLVGAEAFIDRKLNWRLSRRRELGLYPGAIGTAEVVMNRDGRDREEFPGALVIGLGRIGDMDVEELTRSYTHGFMLYSLQTQETNARRRRHDEVHRRKIRPPLPAKLATLLVGHRDSRISLRDSLRAALEALQRVNAALEEEYRIRELRIVELFEDTAVEAAELLRREAENPRFASLNIDPRLYVGRGGQRRVSGAGQEDWVQRIDVRVSDKPGEEGSLSFTTHSGSAIAAEDLLVRNRDEIDAFVDSMTATTRGGERLSHLLFERLFPRAIKRIYSGGRPIQLTLDEQTANYPWELLKNPFAETPDPVAVNTPIIRQLRQSRSDLMPGPGGTGGVLVVGDPQSDFPPLPGAQSEAREVYRAFELAGNFDLSPLLIQPHSLDVQAALLLRKHRIVHLAGHGVCEYKPRDAGPEVAPKTGMVLGPGSFLTPEIIAQMSFPPEFVFLNCCHLARLPELDDYRALRRSRHRLAASLAVQFMRCGARAVIAAGWEVEDGPAAKFATEFYDALLAGETFAESVTRGRRAAYHESREANTWGAYQCYGDPDYRLGRLSSRAPRQAEEQPFSALAQAVVEVENIRKRAEISVYSNRQGSENALIRQLDRVDQRLLPEWRGDSGLLAELGRTYADLGAFDRAIEHYERAIRGERSAAPIEIIGQLANLRARGACLRAMKETEDRDTARREAEKVIRRSIEDMERMLQTLGPTQEGHVLLASAWKRMSIVHEYSDLEHAVEHYARALEITRRQSAGARLEPNPAINARLCAAVCQRYAQTLRSEKASALREAMASALASLPGHDEIAAALGGGRTGRLGFWRLAMRGDLALARAIETGKLASTDGSTTVAAIVDAYRRAWEDGGSSRELSSVVETIDFVRVILDRKREQMATELGALDTMHDALMQFEGFQPVG